MTFDFAPGWLDSLIDSPDVATQVVRPTPTLTAAALAAPGAAPCAPAHPTDAQMARLVGELFSEGSLSFEQLCSLSHAPGLGVLLGDTVAQVTPARRTATARNR